MTKLKPIDASYRLLALLRVCEDASRNIENVGEQELNAATGALASCMELAADLAGIVHDALALGEAGRS